MKRLLLHICCGPCAITTLGTLRHQGFEVTGLFYNPNIHPLTEYVKRRDGCLEVAGRLGVKVIVKDDEYDPKAWFRDMAHREANRCFLCYARRLERTAAIAEKGGFDGFSTTLLYSKHQNHETIADLGRDMARKSAPFVYHDFRQGWSEGIETSREWGIYRQQYCGCLYSENERHARLLQGPKRQPGGKGPKQRGEQ
ncbi:hypothetical protein GKC30_06560 [Pseudodesulfovibrio sp. F-1]|uniref:Epoxyqueuosine reductase QueH n=1 Tax=Pseudodesulfovibrio alkaliphilus TaxID=2661613 RepID=A0A7K1KMI5_9BACT|nr:epoxyqueuosine reductase QueH [Pseudodesulfovibrio alkaliphilus]MUM77289.1 hypothetical protein [Pseudodesulfovibrio alkaliphilus]